MDRLWLYEVLQQSSALLFAGEPVIFGGQGVPCRLLLIFLLAVSCHTGGLHP
jgi:hypothetical protein